MDPMWVEKTGEGWFAQRKMLFHTSHSLPLTPSHPLDPLYFHVKLVESGSGRID